MSIPPKPTSYVAAMKHFFGFREGQSLSQFSEEVKAAGDREFWINGLNANGYSIQHAA